MSGPLGPASVPADRHVCCRRCGRAAKAPRRAAVRSLCAARCGRWLWQAAVAGGRGSARSAPLRVCPDPLHGVLPAPLRGCFLFNSCMQSTSSKAIEMAGDLNGAMPGGFWCRHRHATGRGQTLEEPLDVGITPMTGRKPWGTLVDMPLRGSEGSGIRWLRSRASRPGGPIRRGTAHGDTGRQEWQGLCLVIAGAASPQAPRCGCWMVVVGCAAKVHRDVRSDR